MTREEIKNIKDLDEEVKEHLYFFNEIGLTTKFSCCGHDNFSRNSFEIMFADNLDDDLFIDFLLKLSNKYDHSPLIGKFVKWYRKLDGKIVSNWMYSVEFGEYELNQMFANKDLETMKKCLKGEII